MKGTVVFAYETILKFQPKDLAILKKLAQAYLDADEPDSVIKIGNTILEINPGDGDAEDLMKKASVALAMHQGKWEGSTDFRDQLKNKEEAASLEQSAKAVTDTKSLEELIRKTYDLIQAEPNNLLPAIWRSAKCNCMDPASPQTRCRKRRYFIGGKRTSINLSLLR
jgi:hypothetical protein